MSKRDTDYSNTIIYKIFCKDENIQDVYVGHTTNFVKRKKVHMSSCMKSNNSNHNCKVYQVIRNNGGWDNWQMMIIAFYNCKDLYEARQKEQYHYIELKATLNSVEPMKTEQIHSNITECIKDECDDGCDKVEELHIHSNKTNNNKFVCVGCDFRCSKQSNYNMHLSTNKHKKIIEDNHECQVTPSFSCSNCNKKYSYLSGLCRHKKICVAVKQDKAELSTNPLLETKPSDNFCQMENVKISSAELQNIITETQFCKKMVVELIKTNNNLQAQILELMKSSQTPAIEPNLASSSIGVASNGNYNTINSKTTNNNNTFNMNLFLNEKCKDAMNMKDFVNSIQLNLTDLENVDRLGYVEGMSNIFIDNLQKTDVYKRPVNCSNTRENETYFRLSNALTDGEKDGNIANVIRKVAKKVAIEKANPRAIEDS
jgi:hypothetical protein